MNPDDLFGPGAPFAHIDRDDVELLGTFFVIPCLVKVGRPGGGSVAVMPAVSETGEEPPAALWILAAEYMTAMAAQRSGAGFEKAVELIAAGALTYRNKRTAPE